VGNHCFWPAARIIADRKIGTWFAVIKLTVPIVTNGLVRANLNLLVSTGRIAKIHAKREGDFYMATKYYWRIMATTVLVFISNFGTSAWAQGFRSREGDVWGPRYKRTPQLRQAPRYRPWLGVDAVRRWNEIALNANALDHTPVTPGENREDFRE
jgi:hypothetical protein